MSDNVNVGDESTRTIIFLILALVLSMGSCIIGYNTGVSDTYDAVCRDAVESGLATFDGESYQWKDRGTISHEYLLTTVAPYFDGEDAMTIEIPIPQYLQVAPPKAKKQDGMLKDEDN